MDPPVPPPPAPVSRSSQVALAVFGLVVLALLLFRGYGARVVGARPTDHHPAVIAQRIDLNSADKAELLQLDGVGPAMADAILAHRRERGPFVSVEALTDVHGIGPKTLDKLRPWVTVTQRAAPPPDAVERLERKPTPPVPRRTGKLQPGDPPINVNTATEAELTQLPGVGSVTAQKIIEARGKEPFKVPDDLRRVKGIGVKIMDGIRPFVKCED